jgi:hypothetical protein
MAVTELTATVRTKALDRLAPEPNPYLADPAGWVRDRLGGFLWSKQVAIFESIRDHRRTAVHSCHGSGKTNLAGRAAAWWIDSHPIGSAIVVSSAPTGDQVKGLLWQEIDTAHTQGNLPGKLNQTEWWVGRRQVGVGRKPADYTEGGRATPQTFQGYHRPFMLVILDEAGGIPDWLWGAVGKLTTQNDVPGISAARILAIGNPDFEGSTFSKVCTAQSGWNVVHIDAHETPNFTGEWVPAEVGAQLIGQAFVDDVVKDFGVDSPEYTAQVLGRFPEDQLSGVVPYSGVKLCQGEAATARVGGLRVPVELGVDVGGGRDRTVIRARRGMRAAEVWRLQTDDPEKIADAIDAAQLETGATAIKIDAIGIGFATVGHVRDKLRRRGVGDCAVIGVNVSQASNAVDARGRPRFVNLRAELWWEVGRELTRYRRWDLTECDERTVADLTAPLWFEQQGTGRIQVESKDDLYRRLRRSPDDADALLLAFADPPSFEQGVTQRAYADHRLAGTR